MEKRLNINEVAPKAIKAMYGLEGFVQTSALDKIHKHLIKIRASQINGCAFCIDMHTQEALKDQETVQRIVLLNAWRETNLFTEEEKALLAVTEEITLISNHGLSDEVYQDARRYFDEKYLAAVIMAAIAINAWNRIAISNQYSVAQW